MTAIEQCIAVHAARFLVRDDGSVLLEPVINGPLAPIAADATPYLAEMTVGERFDRRMVPALVPAQLQSDWSLSMAKQDGYAVFTPRTLKLPAAA